MSARASSGATMTGAAILLLVAASCASLPAASTTPAPTTPSITPSRTVSAEPTANASATAAASSATPSPRPLVPWTPPPGPTMLPESARPPEWISEHELDRIAAAVAATLFEAYAGNVRLEDVFTPVAMADATATDSLITAIAKGERRLALQHAMVGRNEHWTRYLPDGTPVRIQLALTVDIAAGATTTDGNGEVIDIVQEPERRTLEFVVSWDGLNERWQIDELRSAALGAAIHRPIGTPRTAARCPWEPGEIAVSSGFDRQVARPWCDGLGREVPRRHLSFVRSGPGHCEWQSASLLHLGIQPGWEIDVYNHHQYGRDPRGIFDGDWEAEFKTLPNLPADAVDTGLTNGNIRLFYVPDEYEEAIYAVMGDVVERWPRLDPPAACH